MEQIILPNVTEKQINQNASVFTVSPLFPGYGHAVGNSLRRTLLSSLPGAAVTKFRVEGLDHEFSTVSGVKEDAVEIMLNLKQLSVTMHETNEPVILQMSVKGPAEVTAANFAANSKISIANPDLHIATLGPKSNFNLEATVEFGRGYDSVEKRENKSKIVGEISIDSLFTPVKAVSIEVENTRVGKMTNYDKLDLTVTTDGTLSPSQAFKAASSILVDQFNLLANYDTISTPVENDGIAADQTSENTTSDIASTGLAAKTVKLLIENGITTIPELKGADMETLNQIAGLSQKALSDITKIRES